MADAAPDQAPKEQSVEDRVFAKFEDTSEEAPQEQPQAEEQEGEAESEEELAEVEYAGSRYKVPKALEPAILQQADYTRKTQELARQREALDKSQDNVNLMLMENEFHQAVQQDLHNVKVLDNYIKSLKAQNFNDMSAEDGFRQWMLIQQANEQRDALNQSVEAKRTEFQTKFQSSISEAKAKTHELLSKAINGYTADSFKAARDYGKNKGFADSVLDSIETDPRAAAVLFKAMRFDELQANKVASVKKLDAPVIKPGNPSRPMPQEVKNKLNYKNALKSAKTRDERNAIQQKYIEGMF